MAQLTILYWRDIPAQVIVKKGRRTAKRELSSRFQEAIDRAAMRGKAHETDAYLADWRRGPANDVAKDDEKDLDGQADAQAALLEQTYDPPKLERLVKNDGREDA